MLKIRLRRMGSRHRPFYRVVVGDSRRTPRASALEEIGYYDPRQKPATLNIDVERADHWVSQGAQPSKTVERLLEKARVETPAAPAEEPEAEAEAPAAPAEESESKEAAEAAAAEPEAPSAETPSAEAPSAPAEASEAEAKTEAEEAPAEEPAKTDETPAPEAEAEAPAEADKA